MGRWWWAFELASHFRFQYFWILAGAALLLLAFQKFSTGATAAGFAAINAFLVAPLYIGAPAYGPDGVRLLAVNVDKANRRFERGIGLVRKTKPDIVVLVEATPGWVAAMDRFRKQTNQYPEVYAIPREDSSGMAIYSEFPLVGVSVESLTDQLPAIVARMRVNGQPLTVIVAHTMPPIGPLYAETRNQQIAQLGQIARRCRGAVTIVGDLNTTSWSPCFQDLVEQCGLRDSRTGFGVQGSWPAGPPRPFHIPIDHCLVSSQIEILDRRVGQDIGSDHFPVIVDFAIQTPSLVKGPAKESSGSDRAAARTSPAPDRM